MDLDASFIFPLSLSLSFLPCFSVFLCQSFEHGKVRVSRNTYYRQCLAEVPYEPELSSL